MPFGTSAMTEGICVTTPEEALKAARAYVLRNRSDCRVKELLEDASDYFVVLELTDGYTEWQLGPGPIFVSKKTGKVWGEAFGNVLGKIDGMQPITGDPSTRT